MLSGSNSGSAASFLLQPPPPPPPGGPPGGSSQGPAYNQHQHRGPPPPHHRHPPPHNPHHRHPPPHSGYRPQNRHQNWNQDSANLPNLVGNPFGNWNNSGGGGWGNRYWWDPDTIRLSCYSSLTKVIYCVDLRNVKVASWICAVVQPQESSSASGSLDSPFSWATILKLEQWRRELIWLRPWQNPFVLWINSKKCDLLCGTKKCTFCDLNMYDFIYQRFCLEDPHKTGVLTELVMSNLSQNWNYVGDDSKENWYTVMRRGSNLGLAS